MSQPFDGIIGHQAILRILMSAVANPASSYIFVGPMRVGKRTIAERFIRILLSLAPSDPHWQIHPDLIVIRPAEGKKFISVEQIRDSREFISLRPSRADRVVIYIPQADRLNGSGITALLKVVEEPPAGAIFIFVTEDLDGIPETLQSRSVILPFGRVSVSEISTALIGRGMSAKAANNCAINAHGVPGLAVEPIVSSSRGEMFVRGFLQARSAGARLARIEEVSAACDAEDDPTAAWKETLLESMREAGAHLTDDSIIAGPLGVALLAAMHFAGSAIPARAPLDACAARLALNPVGLFADLQPDHVTSAFSALYCDADIHVL